MSAPIPPSAPTPPAGNPSGFDINGWHIFDKIAVGAGLVVFVFSFFTSYVTSSITILGQTFSGGESAWHGWALLGLLLTFAAVALVVVKASGAATLPDTVPWPLVTAGAAALGWFLILIRGLTISGASLGWSGWILVLAGLVLAAVTVVPLTPFAGTVEDKLKSVAPNS